MERGWGQAHSCPVQTKRYMLFWGRQEMFPLLTTTTRVHAHFMTFTLLASRGGSVTDWQYWARSHHEYHTSTHHSSQHSTYYNFINTHTHTQTYS